MLDRSSVSVGRRLGTPDPYEIVARFCADHKIKKKKKQIPMKSTDCRSIVARPSADHKNPPPPAPLKKKRKKNWTKKKNKKWLAYQKTAKIGHNVGRWSMDSRLICPILASQTSAAWFGKCDCVTRTKTFDWGSWQLFGLPMYDNQLSWAVFAFQNSLW